MNISGRISIKVYGSVAAVVGYVVFQLISKAFQTNAGTDGSIFKSGYSSAIQWLKFPPVEN